MSVKRFSFRKIIISCFCLVLLTLIGGSWFLLDQTRQVASRATEATLRRASLLVTSIINRQLLQVDGALVSLPALFSAAAKDGQDVDVISAGRLLRGFNFQTFVFRDIILLRPDGEIWASARPNPWNHTFPADQINLDPAVLRGTTAVAGPLRNPLTGDWALLIARHIVVPGAGVLTAVAEVPLPLISILFSAVGNVPGLRLMLERPNGQLLISQPYDQEQIGKVQSLGISTANSDIVMFVAPSDESGLSAIGIMRASLYPDVMVSMTLDQSIAMGDWFTYRNRLVGVVGIVVVLLSALALTLEAARRQRSKADAERGKARAMLDNAIDSMSDGFVMWDREDRLVTCNEQYRRMYHASADFLVPGARFEDIIRGGARLGQYPNIGEDIEPFVADIIAWHRSSTGPRERELPNGRWLLITERKTPDGGVVGIRTDITAMKQALSKLATANDRAQAAIRETQEQNAALRERDRDLHIQNVLFDAALSNMSQGLIMIDKNQNLIVFNNRFLDLFAVASPSLSAGLAAAEIFAVIATGGTLPRHVVDDMFLKQRSLADARQAGSFLVTGEQGQAIAISQRPIADGGWIATYEDASERQRAEQHIRFAAHHDALTQLPNRVLFRIRLDEMIGNLPYRDTGLAMLYLDLDQFKLVNDTLGHPIGDALLEAAARRLLSCLRSTDIAARLGGDEFAIAYISSELPDAAESLAKRVIATLSMPYILEGHTVVVGASVGIALAGSDQMNADTLLKNADMALYQAKSKGRGVCCLFEADMERQLLTRLAIEKDLGTALTRQEFELLYQPLYDLNGNSISGVEALIRWNHPIRGTVSPAHFIPIAEEIGLIRSIGAWVVEKACTDAMKLPTGVRIAVNLSPAQFDSGDIVDIVATALQTSGLPAKRLELEITETALLKNNERTLAQLFRLHALGLRIALDDFGTGYSSLSYLRSFPFDKIKIDQSFVREMATRPDCAAIVSSIVSLANKLNVTTTAEGIETLDQLELIRATGCTEAQGYLFSAPQSLPDVLDYFAVSSGSEVQSQLPAVDDGSIDHVSPSTICLDGSSSSQSHAPSSNTGLKGWTDVLSNNPTSTKGSAAANASAAT